MILPRVRFLVMRPLHKAIEPGGNGCSQHRPKPIYPVIARETPAGHGTTEAASRVQRAARVIDAYDCLVSFRSSNSRRHSS